MAKPVKGAKKDKASKRDYKQAPKKKEKLFLKKIAIVKLFTEKIR